MPILDRALIGQARRRLLARGRVLRVVEFGEEVQETFTLEQIREGAAETGIMEWLSREVWRYPLTQPAIYVIAADSIETANQIAQAFPQVRDFSGPRFNNGHGDSRTLYVGSSEEIRPRLKQHLWRASRTTYAVNLALWCPEGDGGITVKVQPILGDPSREIRQDIEDTLWQQLMPRFGKPGGR